jgi:hypothetical protein
VAIHKFTENCCSIPVAKVDDGSDMSNDGNIYVFF